MRRALVIAFTLAACGGGSSHHPDAGMADAPKPPPGCDYAELQDSTNDFLQQMFMTEDTHVAFSTKSVICGTINNGHFDASQSDVDVDDYQFSVDADTDALVTLTGSGLENISQVLLEAYDPTAGAGLGAGTFTFDHGAMLVHFAAGNYELSVEAYASADIAAPVPYKLQIATDTPMTRCPQITAAADYTEAHDGTTHTDNDVIAIDYNATPPDSLTPATTDVPEPTGLVVAPATNYRITGTSDMVTAADSYVDRDTYAIMTGANTNQLTVRVDWQATTADLDFGLFGENPSPVTDIGGGFLTSNTGPEIQTIAVKPNTTYWLWTGAYTGSTGQPLTYDFSVCGETFAP